MTFDKLYHTANPVFREKIRKEGLVPQVGDSYFLHWEGELFNGKRVESKADLPKYVFLSKEPYDSTYDDDVWEVNAGGLLNLKEDPGLPGALVCDEVIPPSELKLIYEGSGESL